MNTTSYLLMRLAIAASMFGHGLVRIPKLNIFSNWMAASFEKSMLPLLIVVPFSYALPIVEFVVGALLIIGLFTKKALLIGGTAMILLIFGTTMIEHWDALPSQLIHLGFFALLIHYISSNSWALDSYLNK